MHASRYGHGSHGSGEGACSNMLKHGQKDLTGILKCHDPRDVGDGFGHQPMCMNGTRHEGDAMINTLEGDARPAVISREAGTQTDDLWPVACGLWTVDSGLRQAGLWRQHSIGSHAYFLLQSRSGVVRESPRCPSGAMGKGWRGAEARLE
jgi:hypothetical protein